MLFLDMRFDDEEMAALYADYRGEAYTRERDRFEPGYAARNAIMLEGSAYIGQIEAILEPYLGAKPRVLDWGGDTGVNTPFRSRAMQHDVYDISNRPMVEGAALAGDAQSHDRDLRGLSRSPQTRRRNRPRSGRS